MGSVSLHTIPYHTGLAGQHHEGCCIPLGHEELCVTTSLRLIINKLSLPVPLRSVLIAFGTCRPSSVQSGMVLAQLVRRVQASLMGQRRPVFPLLGRTGGVGTWVGRHLDIATQTKQARWTLRCFGAFLPHHATPVLAVP